jgi:hypothetical protein
MVLQEIEKVEEPKFLHSLLMPWELGKSIVVLNPLLVLTVAIVGRYSPQAGHRHVDVRQVVWLCTSNIGHDLVFEFCDALSGRTFSHDDYQELVRLLRPKISQSLGVRETSFCFCAHYVKLQPPNLTRPL